MPRGEEPPWAGDWDSKLVQGDASEVERLTSLLCQRLNAE